MWMGFGSAGFSSVRLRALRERERQQVTSPSSERERTGHEPFEREREREVDLACGYGGSGVQGMRCRVSGVGGGVGALHLDGLVVCV